MSSSDRRMIRYDILMLLFQTLGPAHSSDGSLRFGRPFLRRSSSLRYREWINYNHCWPGHCWSRRRGHLEERTCLFREIVSTRTDATASGNECSIESLDDPLVTGTDHR